MKYLASSQWGIALSILCISNLTIAQDAVNSDADFVNIDIIENPDPKNIITLENGTRIDCTDGGFTTHAMNLCGGYELQLLEIEMEKYWTVARNNYLKTVVNDEYNDDSAADKEEAVKQFDASQESWEAYRLNHCGSIYYNYKSGTIRGPVTISCNIGMVKKRTWQIWSSWLTYDDSTPSVLPEPDFGFVPDHIIDANKKSQ